MEVYGLLASGYGDWPIIKQIAWLLGQVMNGIFNVLSKIGIENIGVCIIIFTIIIYTLMIPLTIKQQKFSKMSAVMQPVPVNDKGFHTGKNLLQKRNLSNFLLCNHRKRNRACPDDRQHIKQTLVIRKKHKPLFFWDIFSSMHINMDISAFNGTLIYLSQECVFLLFRIIICMRCIPAKFDPPVRNKDYISEHHQ